MVAALDPDRVEVQIILLLPHLKKAEVQIVEVPITVEVVKGLAIAVEATAWIMEMGLAGVE